MPVEFFQGRPLSPEELDSIRQQRGSAAYSRLLCSRPISQTHRAPTGRCDAMILAAALREEFCRLYEDDIIAHHQQWVRAIVRCDIDGLTPQSIAELLKNWLHCKESSRHLGPRPPVRGDFDIREVRNSQYFFC
jgi:DNA-directed RNA polymerase